LRKITRDAATAFVQGKRFKRDNTEVRDGFMMLHNNAIAWLAPRSQKPLLSMCGWGTPTTRERINGLLEVLGIPARLHQQGHEQYVYVQGESVPIDVSAEFFFNNDGKLEVL
jgi:hypothetical protein